MQSIRSTPTMTPVLRVWQVRVLLIVAPVMTTAVALLSSTESSFLLGLILNAAAGIIITAAVAVLVGTIARRIADERVAVAQAAEQGVWRTRNPRLAIRSDETGLYNEWYFRLRVQEEIERSRRHGTHCSLMLIPASALPVEGVSGHGGWFGETIGRHLRRTDLPASFQDGPIVVLLPNAGQRSARNLVRRIAKELALDAGQIGLASYPDDGEELPALLSAVAGTAPAQQAA